MNKKELIDNVAYLNHDLPRKVIERCLECFLSTIEDALANEDKICINRFGVIKLAPYKQRTRVNPQTQARMSLPAGNRVKFNPSKELLAKIQ